MSNKKYARVTTVSTFHHTYVVPMDQLQSFNEDAEASVEWLADEVVMERVEEFSQKHLGEEIIDCDTIDEDEMLKLFDKQNEYLKSWSKEKKIEWVGKLLEIGNTKQD